MNDIQSITYSKFKSSLLHRCLLRPGGSPTDSTKEEFQIQQMAAETKVHGFCRRSTPSAHLQIRQVLSLLPVIIVFPS